MIRGLLIILISIIYSTNVAWAQSVCSKKTCVEVEIVSKLADMQRGLQGRDGLAKGKGMLFVFDVDSRQKFWMKDMKFPIDMVWIDNKKRVVSVISSCPACMKDPCEIYAPSKDARYVLELPADFALKNDFKEGNVLRLKHIG